MYCGGVCPKSGRLSDWLKIIVLLCGIVFSPVLFCVFYEIKICVHVCHRDGKMIDLILCYIASHVLIFLGVDFICLLCSLPFPFNLYFCFRLPVDGFPYIFPPPFLLFGNAQPTFSSSTSSTWGSSQICRRIPESIMDRILWERNNKTRYTPPRVSSHCNNCLIFDRLFLNLISGRNWFQVLHDPFVSWK